MKYINLMKTYQGFFSNICQSFQEGAVPDFVPSPTGGKIPVKTPYLTYQVVNSDNLEPVIMQVNIWSRSSSYIELGGLASKLEEEIKEGKAIDIVGGEGTVVFHKGSPFIQNMNDPDDINLKRAFINLEVQVYN